MTVILTEYRCDDGNGADDIVASSPRAAAQQYIDAGDWGDSAQTSWVDVSVTPLDGDGEEIEDEAELVTISIPPVEPECIEGRDHVWHSPAWLGGNVENPGISAHGGGVKITEVCRHCGLRRIVDLWAQRPDTGEQGKKSVEYCMEV